jgi:hypothetical protein
MIKWFFETALSAQRSQSRGARRLVQQEVIYFMKHHLTSKYTLILHQLGWQHQPQSDTLSQKRCFGARVQWACC